jgi:hypothetical protein
VLLGEMSYSIYLVHTWSLRVFIHAARPFTPLGAIDAILCVAAGIAFTVLISYGTYHLIEMPSRVWLRRSLGGMVSAAFRGALRFDPHRIAFSQQITAKRLTFSASAAVMLVALVTIGQTIRSEQVEIYVRNWLHGGRSEVVVTSASYGLNCSTFEVRPPAKNWAAPGNATEKVKRFCRFSAKCDMLVDVAWLGDPTGGCSKDFTVEYECTGRPGVKTGYIPAEAHGKRLVLECPAGEPNATTRVGDTVLRQ